MKIDHVRRMQVAPSWNSQSLWDCGELPTNHWNCSDGENHVALAQNIIKPRVKVWMFIPPL